MKVFSLAVTVLMATEVHCFSTRSLSSKPKTSLRSYLDSLDTQTTSPLPNIPTEFQEDTAPVNGVPTSEDPTFKVPRAGSTTAQPMAGKTSNPFVNGAEATTVTTAPAQVQPQVIYAAPPQPTIAPNAATINTATIKEVVEAINSQQRLAQVEKETNQLGTALVAVSGAVVAASVIIAAQLFNGGGSNVAATPQSQMVSQGMVAQAPATVTKSNDVIVKAQPITKGEVRGLFNLWNDALATGDPAKVANRYAKDGVLLPTLSDIPRNDYEGIKDYFVHFLEKKPDGKILEGEIFVGNNWAQDAGIYEFTFGTDGSKVRGRYSFIYVYEDGEWKISHHHSSQMPGDTVRPAPITKDQVRGFFTKWNDALQTGNPMAVAARYSKDAVLLPTVSDTPRYTTPMIADYFVHFLEKQPKGVITEGNIKIGTNWAQDAGIYEFTYADGSMTRARYSFIYTFEDGEWKIAHHHSSIMPEPALGAMKKVAQVEGQGA